MNGYSALKRAMPIARHLGLTMDVLESNWKRPRSLREVAALPAPRDPALREFLDEFYEEKSAATRRSMLEDRPELTGCSLTDSYLGAVGEHLARSLGVVAPVWVEEPERFLRTAYFAGGLETLKALLLVQSPTAFRRRQIFVDADPLYRPRRETPPIGWAEPTPSP